MRAVLRWAWGGVVGHRDNGLRSRRWPFCSKRAHPWMAGGRTRQRVGREVARQGQGGKVGEGWRSGGGSEWL